MLTGTNIKNGKIELIRSNRKTLAMEIRPTGLVVRAPKQTTDAQISEFITSHQGWIEKHLKELEQRQEQLADVPALTMDEIRELADKALRVIPERVRYG